MTRKDYRSAVDSVSFSADFEQRTIQQLRRAVEQPEKKENYPMKKRSVKTLVLAACLAAALVISAAAAVFLLSPKDVANRLSDPALAAAFESESAVVVDKSVESEGYRFNLAGMVSGSGLSEFATDVDESHTYAVLSIARTDGTPIEETTSGLAITPLVSGFSPRQVNAWTLGGGYISFVENGVAYYLFDCKDLSLFADHTIYLAVYEGFAPGPDTFDMAEDGSISFTDKVEGPRALFTVPLDSAGADPAAAERFLVDCGIVAQ